MLYKWRLWQDNIWKLIVFWITIIIAVWLVWVLWWFYWQKLKENQIISALWSISTDLQTLKLIGLCKTSTWAKISYTPIANYYILTCSNNLWKDLSTFPAITTLSWCKADNNFCKYKLLNH